MPEQGQKSEFESFIEDIGRNQPQSVEQALGLPDKPAETQTTEPDDPAEVSPKNRKERRALERAQAEARTEREARIRADALLEARAVQALEEAGTVDPRLIRLYGSEEQGKEAAALHQQLLNDMYKKAVADARSEFETSRQQAEAEVRAHETFIDTQLEALEDEHDIDLTSNSPAARKARNDILTALEKMSPKDTSGNITEYADIHGVYEMYQLQRQAERPRTSERKADIASRTMERTVPTPDKPQERTPGWSGWRRDYGL